MEINKIQNIDCRYGMMQLPPNSINTIVTSIPYYNMRDYGLEPSTWPQVEYAPMAGVPKINIPSCSACLGRETTIEAYIGHVVDVFKQARRVLRQDGTLWLNVGDTYVSTAAGCKSSDKGIQRKSYDIAPPKPKNLEAKQLMYIPARVALALQADGWILRSDIIWEKPNACPQSVKDRPTNCYEHLFLFSKHNASPLLYVAKDTGEINYNPDLDEILLDKDSNPVLSEKTKKPIKRWQGLDYYYDADSIKEPCVDGDPTPPRGSKGVLGSPNAGRRSGNKERRHGADFGRPGCDLGRGIPWEGREFRNKRDVWRVCTRPGEIEHFATYPPDLIRPCILAGCPPGGIVLDPFAGSGTTGIVAIEKGRNFVGFELSGDMAEKANERIERVKIK